MILMLSRQAASIFLGHISGWSPPQIYGLGEWEQKQNTTNRYDSDMAQRLKYLTSPSGVSDGQSIPHWDGWRDRGPLTFLVFSNWEEILVIIPSAEIYDKRDSTWVTPWRSILNLFRDQFPCREKKDRLPLIFRKLPDTSQLLWEVHRRDYMLMQLEPWCMFSNQNVTIKIKI